jgi:NIMA (never in mitosis gene a)-related kinase
MAVSGRYNYKDPKHLKWEAECRAALAELGLPDGWHFRADPDEDFRVFYYHPLKNITTYKHPTLGYLPPGWCVRMCNDESGKRNPWYFNKIKGRRTKDDPRISDESLKARRKNWKDETTKAIGSVTRMTSGTKLEDLKRQPVKNVNFRNKYDRVHAIDEPGANAIGGMNGGVYVVRLKGEFSRLYVEKK